VWGARGFIGQHLVPALLARGARVTVLARTAVDAAPPPWAERVVWHALHPHGDARADFADAIADAAVVYNLAGSPAAVVSNRQPLVSLDSSCRLQLEFLDACAASGLKPHVVFASSRLVYAGKGTAPVRETDTVAPLSMYAAHKLCTEHYHRIYALADAITYTIARISNPFGEDEQAEAKSHGIVNALIARARRGLPMTLFGRGRQLRDYVYIRDLVDGLIRCAERPEARNQVFNIGCGRSVSMFEAAELIRNRVGGSIEFRPWPAAYQSVESGDFVADISKAGALLGYVARWDLASGLDEMLGRASVSIPAELRSFA
jgi:UDP-glucose 4-epimerase